MVQQEMTKLDETGLVTPTVSVTNGIQLNGSKISGLGNGTVATDAVNKSQLDSVAAIANAALSSSQYVRVDATGGTAPIASGTNAIAVGNGATANGASAIALGDGAKAGSAGSVAIGPNATTTRPGQIALGNSGSTYTAAGIASGASVAAQSGAVRLVTSDLAGNLATTSFDVSTLASVPGRLTALEGQTVLLDQQARGGIAAAIALGGTMVIPDKTVSVSFNLATYRGEQGFSGSAVVRATDQVYLSAGFAGSSVKGSTGGRVGMTFGF